VLHHKRHGKWQMVNGKWWSHLTSAIFLLPFAMLLTEPAQAVTPDADFQARCGASGVLFCEGFDNSTVFTNDGTNGLFPGSATTGIQDTTIKVSGASSVRFAIPGKTSAGAGGFWREAFGHDFGQNSTFYVQYRFRISPEMLGNFGDTSGGTNWKFSIFHNGGVSCGSAEITATSNSEGNGFPIMYGDCGAMGFGTWPAVPNQTTVGFSPPYYKQQGDTATTGYNCQFGTNYKTDPACYWIQANTWYTFYYKVHIGDLTTNGSNGLCKGCSVQAWVGPQGQPLKEWINAPNIGFDDTMPPYNSVDLLNYMTGKDPALDHPTATSWYDELIVSAQPIAAPADNSGGLPPPSPCDVNSDGSTNVSDVQLEVNMALGISSCTNPSGTCTVVSVQRVVNAALGGTCVSP
jgi:hypothetical protein